MPGTSRRTVGYTTSSAIQRALGYTPSRVKPGAGGQVTAYGSPSAVYLDITPGTNTGEILYYDAGTGTWNNLAPAPGFLQVPGSGMAPMWGGTPAAAPPPTFGTGAPVALVSEGATYYDTTASPYVQYVQHSGAWHIT